MNKKSNIIITFIKEFIKSTSVIVLTFILTLMTLYYIGSGQFIKEHNIHIINTINENFSSDNFLKKEHNNLGKYLEFNYKKKHYVLKNNNIIKTDESIHNTYIFSFKALNNNVDIFFPYYATLKYNDFVFFLSLEHYNETLIFFGFILFLFLLIYTFMYHIILYKKLKTLHNFKISAQEYALSERTTSYLVSIMHHKFNTPLKIITTKSRVLAQTIITSELDETIKLKAEKDFINIDNALKTIFEITNKLKTFKSSSQSELNIYKIFEIAIETIEILRDDEFSINVDRKTKLYEIDKTRLKPHEMIQVFINQIKFSIEEMSTEINIKLFYADTEKIKILFSDNGNQLDDEILELFKNKKILDSLDPNDNNNYFDLLLNLNILEESGGSLKILNSNNNGTTYEIIIPTFKVDLKKLAQKKGNI